MSALDVAFLHRQERLTRAASLHWFHWAIVAGSLLLTLTAWQITDRQAKRIAQEGFEREADQTVELIVERMHKYESALWAGVATINAQSHGIDYQEWYRFASTLRIENRYPGINGIGVIFNVLPVDLADFLKAERQLRPEFNIFPKHDLPIHLPITYIEPEDENAAALGLDVAHEANRYLSALAARDSGLAQISGPIVLVQDETKTPGFLFYTPFYEKNKPLNTVEQRREHFLGLVYAPFVFRDLMAGVLAQQKRSVAVTVKDGGTELYSENDAEYPDYDPSPHFKKTVELNFYGRIWHFDVVSALSFRGKVDQTNPLGILIFGLVIDALILAVFLLLARSNRNAIVFAEQMSQQYSQKANDLEIVNAELEAFSYRTSHDLRSPLTSALGLLAFVKRFLQNKEYKKAEEGLARIEKSLFDLKLLVDNILDITVSDKKALCSEPIDVKALIKSTFDKLAYMPNFSRIEVIVDCPEQLIIFSDSLRLGMILDNLISNAVKYYDVSKADPFIKVMASQERDLLLLEVSDNGLGIPAEYKGQIFDMFKRFHSGVASGSGLGLYLVNKAIVSMGGEIVYVDCASVTTFKVSLPLSQEVVQNV